MTILESIKDLPQISENKSIYSIADNWAEKTFPDSMDPHPEYRIMASPTIEQICNWSAFKILCECFFTEGYKCASNHLSEQEEIDYYKNFCENKKQDIDRNSNRFSFGAGLAYYKLSKLNDGK